MNTNFLDRLDKYAKLDDITFQAMKNRNITHLEINNTKTTLIYRTRQKH